MNTSADLTPSSPFIEQIVNILFTMFTTIFGLYVVIAVVILFWLPDRFFNHKTTIIESERDDSD